MAVAALFYKTGHVPLIIGSQFLLIILFGVFADYGNEADAKKTPILNSTKEHQTKAEHTMMHSFYPMFQDVHVMIFVGFGFLMTFLKRYGYSAVGLNFLLAALAIQWAILCQGFFAMGENDGKIPITVKTLLEGDFAAAAVLISFGAVLGVTSPSQLVTMVILEIALYAFNAYIGTLLQVVDIGGSMFIHVFGAYFGLAVSLMLHRPQMSTDKEGSVYNSDIFSMIGTIFLWIFWPSFNAAVAVGDDQHRAVINTYFSLAACCLAAFALSVLVSQDNKFDMVHIQNATLAGGVAVGTTADLMLHPFGSMLVGVAAGIVSVLGYRYLSPILYDKLRIHDTCGVNNLHGMPGIMAGLIGAIMAAIASEAEYGYSLYEHFPARAPLGNTTEFAEIKSHLLEVEPGVSRSASSQASYQLAALGITLIIAIVGGLLTGLILRLPIWGPVPREQFYDDVLYFSIPDVEEVVTQPPEAIEQTNPQQSDTKI